MAIKLCTNTIPTSNKISFKEIVDRFASKKLEKMANATKKVKTAGDVVDREPGDGPDSGQPEWEGKKENVNEPEVQDEQKKATSDQDIKKEAEQKDEAESSGQLKVEPLHQKGESENAGNEDLTGDKKKTCVCPAKDKKAAGIDNFGEKKAPPFGKKDEDKDEDEDKDKKEEDEDKDKEEKDAGTQGKFIRLAKLNDKTRSWLKDYWRNIYPEDYVDAMLAD